MGKEITGEKKIERAKGQIDWTVYLAFFCAQAKVPGTFAREMAMVNMKNVVTASLKIKSATHFRGGRHA